MSKPRFQKYNRKFLNKSKGTACIETTVEVWTDDVQCDVKITDCFRAISLDFNTWDIKTSAKSAAEHLHKFDTLISELQAAREAFVKAVDVAKTYVDKEEKPKKAKKEVPEPDGFVVPDSPIFPQ